MSRLTKVDLTAEQRAALEAGYKHGQTHGLRQRCHMILLKAQKKPSREVAQQLGCCMISVNHWVKRYQSEGMDGLHIRAGRGRKTILCSRQDLPAVRQAVAANRPLPPTGSASALPKPSCKTSWAKSSVP